MDWQLVHSVMKSPLTNSLLKTDYVFKSNELIIEAALVMPLDFQQDWYRAGFVSPVFSFPETGLVNGQKQDIALKRQHLKLTTLPFPYQVELYFHNWINSISLRFWEPINTLEMPGTSTGNSGAVMFTIE